MFRGFLKSKRPGQTFMELVVGIGVFALIASSVTLLVFNSFDSNRSGQETAQAAFYAQQGIDAVKSIRDRGWNNLADGAYGLSSTGGYWAWSGSSETLGKFTRTVTISGVNRDAAGNIAESGGSPDIRTKKTTVSVAWTFDVARPREVSQEVYLTDWNSYDWKQDTDAHFNAGTLSNTVVNGIGSAAVVALPTAPNSSWTLSGSNTLSHTSDVDFNATHSNTAVNGTGSSAEVRLGTTTGWTSQASPVSTSLNSTAMVAANDGWAVGSSGVIVRWNGSLWSSVSSPTVQNLRALHMVSSSDGWAVGDNGVIVRWNGSTWSVVTSPSSQSLLGIYMVSGSDGWAVGKSGNILRWNGSAWSLHTDTGSQTWSSVYMVSGSVGWVVGSSGNIYRWNGSAWSLHTDTGNHTWNSIYMVSGSDGWVVGSSGNIYRWNGSAWSLSVDTGSQTWNSVYMVSGSDGWVVGSGGNIYRWNGSAWVSATSPTVSDLISVRMVTSFDGWAVGASGAILRYTNASYYANGTFISLVLDSGTAGTNWNTVYWTPTLPSGTTLTVATRTGNTATPDGSWSSFSSELSMPSGEPISSPAGRYLQYRLTLATSSGSTTPALQDISLLYNQATGQNLNSVHGASANDVWGVGQSGTIVRWNGTSWSLFADTGLQNWTAIYMVSDNDGWLAGSAGEIYRWNGSSWSLFTDTGSQTWNSVHLSSASDGWLVGSAGEIYRWNGSSWVFFVNTGLQDWNSVYMLSATDGWVVGSSGNIRRWNGSSWASVSSPTGSDLHSVHMVSASDGWAVGQSGTIIRWNGTSWATVSSPTSTTLRGLYMSSASDGWACGNSGVLLNWNGSSWTSKTSPATSDLYDVFISQASPTYDGWIVGSTGKILRAIDLRPYSGTFLSSVLDSDQAVSEHQAMSWMPTVPVGTTLTLAMRIGNTATPDGTWTLFTSESSTSGGTTLGSIGRYVQYRASFSRVSDLSISPQLDNITINYRQ